VTAAAEQSLIARHRGPGVPAPLPLTVRDLIPEAEPDGQVEPLGAGWMTVTVIIGVMAALIALGGMVLSFRAVSTEMIPAFGARWAWLVPIVVDLTVFVFSGVDLVLARLDMSHPLARWTVYGATGGTVWLNYSVGGSPAGRVAHVLMPAIWVVFVELMRHVVRRQANLATGSHREPIPAARWLLSPWPTLKLWRRMVLWRVHSYPRALEQEKMRLGAVAAAREVHGRFWRLRISPLVRLRINLGELGAHDVDPAAWQAPAAAGLAHGGATGGPASGAQDPAGATSVAAAPPAPHGALDPTVNGYAPAAGYIPEPEPAEHASVERVAAPVNGADRAAAPQRTQPPTANGHDALPGVAAPPGVATPGPPPPGLSLPGTSLPGPSLPGVTAAGAAAGAVAREATARHASSSAPATATAPAQVPPAGAVPAQRAHAAAPAVPFPQGERPGGLPNGAAARQEPPHVEFQAPPAMPPLPRRSTRESELLTAAREVERWRGQPSASRISRELGIGMALATSLANALRDEDGLAPDDPR
jgi:hypothetical protein